ncbi:MAG TPA: alpha/beta hydrolase, partial [Aggregatilineales bacterium]|nr:alpha/beta hydrolase [Aggregatilineales bacterium]
MAHSILAPTDFHTETIRVGDLTMNVALEGDPDAPLVLLLHGFPEFWYSWRHQIKALAAAGYRVAAPDQRGYNLTEKKPPYDLITLSNDAAGVITALGKEKAFVVGHDWGGGVAWIMGAYHPEMVEKVVICNVPHPLVMAKMLRSSPRQLLKSWYMLFFQLPALPEALLAMRNYKALVDTLKSVSTVTPEEIEYFKVAWKQPGALNGSLNWYRIAFRTLGKGGKRDLI